MNFHFWSFIAGGVFILTFQWVTMIPFYRRHKVVRALLDRAKMYQKRGEKLSDAGKEEEALAAWRECRSLLEQVEKLTGVNGK
jgi:hypothetical protein